MYKPPENTNRVKSIKSKFESIEKSNGIKQESHIFKNGTRNNLSMSKSCSESTEDSVSPLNLQRQLSDPSKRNIKRSPAFRLDKNVEKVVAFQRGSILNKSQAAKPTLKPTSAPNINCDIATPKTSEHVNLNSKVPFVTKSSKPILFKSKTSIDFNLLRNKFSSENTDNSIIKEPNQRNEECKTKNVSALYTEPIPKSLRVKTCDTTMRKPIYSNLDDLTAELKAFNGIETNDIHISSTLKVSDKEKSNKKAKNDLEIVLTEKSYGGIPNGKPYSVGKVEKNNNIDSNSALKKLDTLLELTKTNSLKKANRCIQKPPRLLELSLELTDTLKHALKRPLPTGPAPEKPPRTFAHCGTEESIENLEKNISFLHVTKDRHNEIEKPLCLIEKPALKRSDPKYMLNKLETALRNNKLRSKRSVKTDVSTTSGEDSDDNIFFKNNINNSILNPLLNRSLPSVPDTASLKCNNSSPNSNSLLVQALNFNCMNGYNCVSSPYSKLNESKSSFFVSVKNEEPVYAEPWHFQEGLKVRNGPRARSVSSDRNSKNKRNSLYYLSSPVLCSTPRSSGSSNMDTKKTDVPSPNQMCGSKKCSTPDISSASSVSSESAASTPLDDMEKSFETSINIKQLIDVFETKRKNSIEKATDINVINSNGYGDNLSNGHLDYLSNGHEDISSNGHINDFTNGSIDFLPEKRLDDLRTTLRRTIEDSFETVDSGSRDSNSESEKTPSDRKPSVDDPTVKKFRTYLRNVSVYAKTRPQWKKSTLFDCCLIVEWNADVRRIKFKFPPDVEVPHKIEDLCFPDAACGPIDKTTNAQCYSLVITDDKGERTFGYCRRVVPEGSNKCLPIAYCILSKHKSPRFYKKILIELESRHGISEYHRNNLLTAFYFKKFPQPGETVIIKLADSIGCGRNKETFTSIEERETENTKKRNSLEDSIESNFVIVNEKGEYEPVKSEKDISNNNTVNTSQFFYNICEESGDGVIMLNLHHDPIYENSDLKDLHGLPTEILQKILASLLLERKVILISCLLSKLSSCVEALQAIIYPFTWPHSFIPVLPKSLWEFVESPTPIICGILSVEVINEHDIEYGIVVDLDERCILKEEGDEDKALSNSMLKAWRKSIAAAKNIPSDQEAHSYHLTDAYIHMFALVLKNYRDYIVNGNFQKEAFIRSGKSKGVRRFLKWFTDTSMFQTFVEAVITNSQDFSMFDEKIALCETSGLILDKLLDWK